MIKKYEILKKIYEEKIVGIVRVDSVEKAEKTMDALYRGGLSVVELTFTIPYAHTILEALTKKYRGSMVIGAGTVLDEATARLAILSGAEFLVTPTVNPDVVRLANRYGIPCLSGVNTPTELVAALINQKSSFAEGIRFAQTVIEGSANILLLCDDGSIIVARDRLGRIPVLIGKREDGYAVSFESFAYVKLDFEDERELGPAEIVRITPDGVEQLAKPGKEMRMCAFLWSYYGYPTSTYEGVNVEEMRYRNGEIMAEHDAEAGNAVDLDYVSGVPDSGTPHAIGYANRSHAPFARPYIKYTPTWSRSFMPGNQSDRRKTAKMKQIAIHQLIKDKNLLFVDDSIVRGTQLQETVDFLYAHGAKSVHMRSACPPIMYGCKFLNFSRNTSDMDLITRRVIMELEGPEGFKYLSEYSDGSTERGKNLRKAIAAKFNFSSLEFQSLEGVVKAIGLEPCKLCTYCWTGKE